MPAFDGDFGSTGLVEWASEVSGVEEQKLDALAFLSVDLGVVDSGSFAAFGIFRFFEEIEEDLLGFLFLGEFRTGVVLSVIMIVPNGENLADGFQAFVAGHRSQLLILGSELFHVGGVAVNVVTQENEDIGLGFDDAVPDGLGEVLFGAGTKGNGLNGFAYGWIDQSHGKQEGECTKLHLITKICAQVDRGVLPVGNGMFFGPGIFFCKKLLRIRDVLTELCRNLSNLVSFVKILAASF